MQSAKCQIIFLRFFEQKLRPIVVPEVVLAKRAESVFERVQSAFERAESVFYLASVRR